MKTMKDILNLIYYYGCDAVVKNKREVGTGMMLIAWDMIYKGEY